MGWFLPLMLALAPQASGELEPKAAPPLSFQATLDAIRISGRPGQVVTRQFRLTLDKDQRPAQFRARVEDWWRSPDGRQSFYAEPGTLGRSCGEWVSLNPVESAVQPGETLTIRLTVALPEELRSGGYWCALTVDQVPDPVAAAAGTVGVQFVASVSTGIFVDVDPVQREASVVAIDLGGRQVLVRVRNEGNAPVSIDGRLEFFAADAAEPVASSLIGRATLLTEPSREGVLTAPLPSPDRLPSGRYRVRAVLDLGLDYYIGAEREIDVVREASSAGAAP